MLISRACSLAAIAGLTAASLAAPAYAIDKRAVEGCETAIAGQVESGDQYRFEVRKVRGGGAVKTLHMTAEPRRGAEDLPSYDAKCRARRGEVVELTLTEDS